MSDKEISDFQKVLKAYKGKVTRSKESSRKFLFELGVITEKGKLKKNYKHLCIPEEQV